MHRIDDASTYSCSSFSGLVSSKRRWQTPVVVGEAEVQADRLGVAEVQVAIGFSGGKRVRILALSPRGHEGTTGQIVLDDAAQKVGRRLTSLLSLTGGFQNCR